MLKKLKLPKTATVLACLQLANPLVFAADPPVKLPSVGCTGSSVSLGRDSFLEKVHCELGKDYLKEFRELFNKARSKQVDWYEVIKFYNEHFVCVRHLDKSLFDLGSKLYAGRRRNSFHFKEVDCEYIYIPGADCTYFSIEYNFWKEIDDEINHEIDDLRYSCSEDSNYKCDQLESWQCGCMHNRLYILKKIVYDEYDLDGYNMAGFDEYGLARDYCDILLYGIRTLLKRVKSSITP